MRMWMAAGMLGLAGCGTMFGRGPDVVPISSEPPGAEIQLDGRVVGQTPMDVSIKRDTKPHRLVLRAEGYESHSQELARHFNGWCGLNCIFLISPVAMVAWGLDYMTGNLYGTNDDPVHVDLRPLTPPGGQ